MDAERPVDVVAPVREPARRRSVVFDRIVPVTAAVLVVALLALFAYSLLQPNIGNGRPSGIAINTQGALVNVDPEPAKDFSLTSFEGEEIQLSALRGQVVVVNFWASWCPPCREEAPALETSWQALRDEGVVFVGVDVWDDQDDALAFIDEFGITYMNGPDKGAIAIDYGVTGIPETYIIDREGQIAAKFIGPVTVGQLTDTVRSVGGSPVS